MNSSANKVVDYTVYFVKPVQGDINKIYFSNVTGATGKELAFILTDLTGRQLRADRPGQLTYGLNAYFMDETGVQPGIYFGTVCIAATKTVS